MLNPKLLKLAIDVLKELPAGAVYSNTKKPPEGATEYTTDGGAKYWIPKKRKGKKTTSEDIDAFMAELRAKYEAKYGVQMPRKITSQNIDELTNLDYIDSLKDGHIKNMLSLRLWFGDIDDKDDQESENYKKLAIIQAVRFKSDSSRNDDETTKKREEILSKLVRKRREGKLTNDELFEKIDTKHDQYKFNDLRKPLKYFEDNYIEDDGTLSPTLLETGLGRRHARNYRERKFEHEMFTYDLVKKRPNIFPKRSFPPETIEDMPDSQKLNSKITPELSTVAHKALLKDRDIYKTILEAYQSVYIETLESGAVRSQHTAIDDAVNGKKDDVSYKEFYETFEPVRKHLKETFGDTITLYRATARTEDEVHADDDDKPTRNFASSREQAMQYGTRIIKEEVPIENILALNVAIRGTTDEFIVLRGEHAITKSISKSMNNKILTRAMEMLKELPQGAVYSTTRKPPKGAKVFTTTGGTEYWMPSQQDKKPTPQNQKNTNEAIAKLVQEKVKRGGTGEGREVELSKDELSYVLSTGSYALISGGRNSNIKEEADLDEQDEKFVKRHEELKSELVNSGYAHTEITGHYGGEEKSFLVMVHDQDESEMKELGKKYNQDSVIVASQGKQKMFFTTGENEGSYFSGSGWEQTQDAETDYTLFKTSDGTLIKFSLNFDFDNMNTDEGESAQIEKAIIEQFLHIIHRKPPDQNLKKITRVLV